MLVDVDGLRHDVGMQIVGQPARDLCRHFVQRYFFLKVSRRANGLPDTHYFRWNYLLRTKVRVTGPIISLLKILIPDGFSKTHSRVMPFLLPAPDFKITELTEQGLTGTCEIQICRSAGPWSLGTTTRIEHSIQNAYLKGT